MGKWGYTFKLPPDGFEFEHKSMWLNSKKFFPFSVKRWLTV